MKRNVFLALASFTILMSCTPEPEIQLKTLENLDIQGHRGARGLFPENSLPGFQAALEMGANSLELDVVISKDAEIVVSHEPWMNADICRLGDSSRIEKAKEKDYNIYRMSYSSVKNYDCGSLGNPDFPEQKKMYVYKPTLREVITRLDTFALQNGLPLPHYNIEIKRRKGQDMVFHPEYDFFAQRVMLVINDLNIQDRATVQSFDLETLQYLRENFRRQELGYLTYSNKELTELLRDVVITPEIYSPHFKQLDERQMEILRSREIKVIPWTVNEVDDMKRMLALGVDGIITDYPNRLVELVEKLKQEKQSENKG